MFSTYSNLSTWVSYSNQSLPTPICASHEVVKNTVQPTQPRFARLGGVNNKKLQHFIYIQNPGGLQ